MSYLARVYTQRRRNGKVYEQCLAMIQDALSKSNITIKVQIVYTHIDDIDKPEIVVDIDEQ